MQRIDLMPTFAARVTCAGKYWCFKWLAKEQSLRYEGKHSILTWLCAPIGVAFRIYYKLVRGF